MSKKNQCAIIAHNKPITITRERAIELNQNILNAFWVINDQAYKLGRWLCEMKDSQGYKLLGQTNFEEYIRDLRWKRRTIYNLMVVDRCFQERLKYIKKIDPQQLVDTHYSKMVAIAHIVLDKNPDGSWKYDDKKVMEWLNKAHVHTQEDLYKELKDFKEGKEYTIKPDPDIIYAKGTWDKVFEEERGGHLTLQITRFKPPWNASCDNFNKVYGGKNLKIKFEVEE